MRGATSNLELPKLRLFIRVVRFPNRASVPIKTPANLRLDAFLPYQSALRQKLVYPERGTSKYLVRASLRSNDVCYLGI
jgi:hypothetical protein